MSKLDYLDLTAESHARSTDPENSHEAAMDIVNSGRMSSQCKAILNRLQQGEATSLELSALSLKYTSRISDLRKAGYVIAATKTDGIWTYRLLVSFA